MQVRFALLAVLLAAASGCATEPEQKQAGAAAPATPASATATAPQAAPQAVRQSDYRPITGSRLRSLDDDTGAGYVSGQSKQDYMDDMNSRTNPLRGN